ncbi:MAG: carboxypeptidase-like regulatory domain-containing protein [Bacteroidota bacterium]
MTRTHSFALPLLLLVFTAPVMAQSKTYTIHGKVTSFEESLALEGAIIRVKGTSAITGTQADGTFSLDVADATQVLIIELTGYETQQVTVGEERQFDIALKVAANTAFVDSSKHLLTGQLKPPAIHHLFAVNFSR